MLLSVLTMFWTKCAALSGTLLAFLVVYFEVSANLLRGSCPDKAGEGPEPHSVGLVLRHVSVCARARTPGAEIQRHGCFVNTRELGCLGPRPARSPGFFVVKAGSAMRAQSCLWPLLERVLNLNMRPPLSSPFRPRLHSGRPVAESYSVSSAPFRGENFLLTLSATNVQERVVVAKVVQEPLCVKAVLWC